MLFVETENTAKISILVIASLLWSNVLQKQCILFKNTLKPIDRYPIGQFRETNRFGGMQDGTKQRCGIAEMLHHERDLLILTGGMRDSYKIDSGIRDETQKITGHRSCAKNCYYRIGINILRGWDGEIEPNVVAGCGIVESLRWILN